MNTKTKRNGFTLAEVIITIGIIGVVAALIVPNLVQALQEKGMTTSATVFERKLDESLRFMNTADEIGGYETTEDFVNALSKHMKISKTCDNNNLKKCFKENFVDAEKHEIRLQELKTARQMAVSDYGTETIGVMFANGVSAILAYDKNCEGNPYDNNTPVMSCVSLIYDINGTGKPNRISKDIHTINTANNLGVIATINGVKVTGIAKAGTYPVVDCTNTSGPDYKYCEGSTSYDNDYWAGASKYCGGKSNMASDEDLQKIASFLYSPTSITTNSEVTGLVVNNDNLTKLNSYGFPNPPIYVWSLDVASFTIAYGRYFPSTSTFRTSFYRNGHGSSDLMAVCVKH